MNEIPALSAAYLKSSALFPLSRYLLLSPSLDVRRRYVCISTSRADAAKPRAGAAAAPKSSTDSLMVISHLCNLRHPSSRALSLSLFTPLPSSPYSSHPFKLLSPREPTPGDAPVRGEGWGNKRPFVPRGAFWRGALIALSSPFSPPPPSTSSGLIVIASDDKKCPPLFHRPVKGWRGEKSGGWVGASEKGWRWSAARMHPRVHESPSGNGRVIVEGEGGI